MSLRSETVLALVSLAVVLLGCKSGQNVVGNESANNTANTTARANTAATQSEDGTIPSGTGVEKEKPAAGKGNVQGKAMFNEKPAVAVQVKLCKTFSRFLGGCSGETFSTKTDDAGEYLIKDVPPGVYEGLTVQVFDTPY